MNVIADSLALIDLLARHEEQMADLYRCYADCFPAQQSFWQDLAHEEVGHANMIAKLGEKTQEGIVHFENSNIRREAIASALQFLEKEEASARNGKVTLIEALSVALALEYSLFDRKFYAFFDGDSHEVQAIFAKMRELIDDHIGKVEQAWARYQPETPLPQQNEMTPWWSAFLGRR